MITSIFKNSFVSYIIVSIIAIVIWGAAYIEITLDTQVSLKIANHEFLLSRKTAILLSFVVTIFGAMLLNFKLKKHLFSYEPTNLFMLFFVLINSVGLNTSSILSFSIVAFLLVLLVNYLFYFTDNIDNENQIFNSGIILGLLIYQNLVFALLLPLLFQNLRAIKQVSIKEIFLIIIGFSLPTVFVVLFSMLTDTFSGFENLFQWETIDPKVPWKFGLYFLVLMFFSIIGYRLVVAKRTGIDINIIRLTRNMFVYFITILAIIGISLFIFEKEYVSFVFAIPLSIFLSDYFANSSFKFKEILFLILISVPFLLRFLN